jgi:hypothetical protein
MKCNNYFRLNFKAAPKRLFFNTGRGEKNVGLRMRYPEQAHGRGEHVIFARITVPRAR